MVCNIQVCKWQNLCKRCLLTSCWGTKPLHAHKVWMSINLHVLYPKSYYTVRSMALWSFSTISRWYQTTSFVIFFLAQRDKRELGWEIISARKKIGTNPARKKNWLLLWSFLATSANFCTSKKGRFGAGCTAFLWCIHWIDICDLLNSEIFNQRPGVKLLSTTLTPLRTNLSL